VLQCDGDGGPRDVDNRLDVPIHQPDGNAVLEQIHTICRAHHESRCRWRTLRSITDFGGKTGHQRTNPGWPSSDFNTQEQGRRPRASSQIETSAVWLIAQTKTKDADVRLLHVVEPFPWKLAEAKGSSAYPDLPAARVEQRAVEIVRTRATQ
jgi:hypothetical protein